MQEKFLGPSSAMIKSLINILMLLIVLLGFTLYSCNDSSNSLSPLSSDATILAFGDSLTHGTGANNGEDYPTLLTKLTNINVINAGVPGEVSSKGLERLPALLDEHNPDLLILIHGAERSRKAFTDDTIQPSANPLT